MTSPQTPSTFTSGATSTTTPVTTFPSTSPSTENERVTTSSQSMRNYTSTELTTRDNQPLGIGVICAIVGAGVALIVIFVIVIILFHRRRRQKQKGPPPTLPDPYPKVNPDPSLGHTSSTIDLVRNDSLDQTTGTSADSLPMAPQPPQLDYEPPDTLLTQSRDTEEEEVDELPQDYVEPSKWGHATSDDVYIPMGIPIAHHTEDMDKPVPSSQLVNDYDDSHAHNSKPSACVGSVNLGYVNVPGSQPSNVEPVKAEPNKVGTLPKYANLHSSTMKGEKLEQEEEEGQEDYENVPRTKSVENTQHSNTSRAKMKELVTEAAQRNGSPRPRTSPKPQSNPKSKSATTPKNTNGSNPSTPKAKHKTWSKPTAKGDGVADYVNIQEYSKKPHPKDGHLEEMRLCKK